MRVLFRTALAVVVCAVAVGCNSSSTPSPAPVSPATETSSHDGHDHGHSHAHPETGPNGGHLVELGDEEYHIEWTHDDESGLVTLYIVDGAVKELVPIPADSITVSAKIEKTEDYVLLAVEPIGEPPTSAKFELKNPELIESLKLAGRGTEVSIPVTINGKDYVGVFEHHDHGHGHNH